MSLKSRLIYWLYGLITTVIAPLGMLYLMYKKRRDPPYGRRACELLGHYSTGFRNCIWFHTVSVGEAIAARPLIKAFMRRHPKLTVLVTTTTTSGAREIEKIEGINHVFAPLDSPLAVWRFLRNFNPSALYIMETELWPSLLNVTHAWGTRICIINARMPEKTCLKYLEHRTLTLDLISSKLDLVLCQTAEDMERFKRIGVPSDRLRMTGSLKYDLSPDEPRFRAVLGPMVEMDWESTPTPVVSRRIVVTKSEYNGVALGALRLHTAYQLNCTRINRAGVDLLASPNLRLQMGDRVTVVGTLEDINRLANRLGNSMKRLNEPNLITIFIGIMFGIILGSINVGFGMKLGLAGGPLVVAILISRFGYKFKLVTYTSSSASMLMRELGICLFLASVGISSGQGFAATVFNTTGMWWVIWGFMITLLPLVVVGVIARGVYKINFLTIMGLMSGGCTDPPALAYANNSTGNDAPAVAYSTVYPLTMFLRVVAAQVLILCFM